MQPTSAPSSGVVAQIAEDASAWDPTTGAFSLGRLKAEPSARFVKLLPHALPARYDPSAEDSREIAAGRLVILSAFPDIPAIASPDMKRDPAASHCFRQNCLAMNDFAARLCSA